MLIIAVVFLAGVALLLGLQMNAED